MTCTEGGLRVNGKLRSIESRRGNSRDLTGFMEFLNLFVTRVNYFKRFFYLFTHYLLETKNDIKDLVSSTKIQENFKLNLYYFQTILVFLKVGWMAAVSGNE